MAFVGAKLFYILQPLFRRRNVRILSLFYRYLDGNSSVELHVLVPPFQIFRARTQHATQTTPNHSHFLLIPSVRNTINLAFPQKPSLCGTDSRDVSTNFSSLKSNVIYLAYSCLHHPFTPSQQSRSVTL